MTADNHPDRDDFTIMSHESHGQCFCSEGVHCGNGIDCTGSGDHPDLDITAIRERAEKATKGPWKVYQDGILAGVADTDDAFVAEPPLTWNDAEFIAHAREDIDALLAVVERLQGELDAQTVEWGVQMIADGRVIDAKTVAADELVNHMPEAWRHVSRKVGPWLPVPTDGAEN